MLARLWTLALAARAAGATSLYRLALDQRESLFAALEAGTGKRHYWAVTVPGGVRDDLDLAPLQEVLSLLEPRLGAWKAAVGPTGLIGRTGNQMGAISTDQVQTIGLAGLAARGSGVENDLRITKPYAAYSQYQVQLMGGKAEEEGRIPAVERKLAGDVTSRLSAAAEDLVSSHSIAQSALGQLSTEPAGTSAAPEGLPVPAERSLVTSSVECPHGPISVTFQFTSDGVMSALELEPPGAILVEALPQLLEGRLLLQVPLILTSLDLCIECLDQ
jgi:NADH:ubiquinone oxidoreductase subunit D